MTSRRFRRIATFFGHLWPLPRQRYRFLRGRGRTRLLGLMLLVLWMLFLAACSKQRTDSELVVSVAANLKPVMTIMAPRIQDELGVAVTYNYGASGKLAQQIEQGAPVDVFLSANAHYVDELIDLGMLDPASKQPFARGRLVLWMRDPALPISGLDDLSRPDIKRIAIANPDHAPYGMAAREALQAAGLWENLQSRLIFGEDVTQSYQYAATGNVDVALIPLSLVNTETEGRWVDVPAELYTPLEQTAAIVKKSQHVAKAQAFITFLTSPVGQDILARNGYALPTEVVIQ